MSGMRGIDTDPGWIRRRLEDLQRQIEQLRSARSLGASTIDNGDLNVRNGGGVRIEDGGGVRIEDGGDFSAYYPDNLGGARACQVGPFYYPGNTTGRADGYNISLFNLDGVTPMFSVAVSTDDDEITTSALVVDTQNIQLVADLAIAIAAQAVSISGGNLRLVGLPTTGNAANTYVDATTGQVFRSTSSARRKVDIQDHAVDVDAVLGIHVRSWREKHDVERNPDTTRRYVGAVAEELDALGLTEFVLYDDQGRPDAIQEPRLALAVLAVVQAQQKQLDEQKAQHDREIASLKVSVANLTATLSKLTKGIT